MNEMSELSRLLLRQIERNGPIGVDEFMSRALFDPVLGYYTTGVRLGMQGDFLTAPEFSPLFGETIGRWCVHEWEAMGRPRPVNLIEVGAGDGTLMADLLCAARFVSDFVDAARVHLVDMDSKLDRARRAVERRVGVTPHVARAIASIADGDPTIVIGNEFLDCLPLKQFVRRAGQWRERVVCAAEGRLAYGISPAAAAEEAFYTRLRKEVPEDCIREMAPGLAEFIDQVARLIASPSGRALFIDYGETGFGDSLHATLGHARVDPLATAGEADLTAFVDFAALKAVAGKAGLAVHGPRPQGDWLRGLGLEKRAAVLSKAHPNLSDAFVRQLHRLTHPSEMGVIFKAVCLSGPELPTPVGF
jgi:NADH dehydrogenase [ubiquinone] 1 alpha subcomplex assembly factor 7